MRYVRIVYEDNSYKDIKMNSKFEKISHVIYRTKFTQSELYIKKVTEILIIEKR